MPTARDFLPLLRDIRGRLDGDLALERLAARSGWSPFHFHRTFRRLVSETPKQFTLRLRLEAAAARLVSSADRVVDVAVAAGFDSHEVFTRAFRRHFGRTPSRYRALALGGTSAEGRGRHRALVEAGGACIHLHHLSVSDSHRRVPMPTLSIERRDLAAQPVLFVRMRPGRHELASAIAAGLGKAYPFAQRAGFAMSGPPYTRYHSTGPGLFSIDVGVPLAAPGAGDGDVEAGSLPGGPVAVALHGGPYDQLSETYTALERWIEERGVAMAGAPWEVYLTDPADLPDPADWRTEVYWPLAE